MSNQRFTCGDILLTDAFNLVGRRIFGDAWTGNEANCREVSLIDMLPTALLDDDDLLIKKYGLSALKGEVGAAQAVPGVNGCAEPTTRNPSAH